MDEREVIGNFWLPSVPARQVSGRLMFGHGGASLTVFGTLRDYGDLEPNVAHGSAWERIEEPVVFGFIAETRETVTLRGVAGDVLGLSPTWFIGLQMVETFAVEVVLVGGHTAASEVQSIRIGLDLLHAWANPPSLVKGWMVDGEVTLSRGVVELHVATHGNQTIRLIGSAEGPAGHDAVHVERRVFVEVSGIATSIDVIQQEHVRPIHDLLILCLGRSATITEMRILIPVEGGTVEWLNMYSQLTQLDSITTLDPHRVRQDDAPTLLVPEEDSVPFSAFVPRWHLLRQEYLDAFVAFFAPFYASFIYSEHVYASTFQAAEALARKLFRSQELEKCAHSARVGAVLAPAQEAGVDPEVLDWAARVLTARNDRPLRELIAELLDDSGLFLPDECDSLARRMATARAGVSHGGANSTSTLERSTLGQVLRWVIRGRVVRDLGVDADAVRQRIEAKPGFRWAKERALRVAS